MKRPELVGAEQGPVAAFEATFPWGTAQVSQSLHEHGVLPLGDMVSQAEKVSPQFRSIDIRLTTGTTPIPGTIDTKMTERDGRWAVDFLYPGSQSFTDMAGDLKPILIAHNAVFGVYRKLSSSLLQMAHKDAVARLTGEYAKGNTGTIIGFSAGSVLAGALFDLDPKVLVAGAVGGAGFNMWNNYRTLKRGLSGLNESLPKLQTASADLASNVAYQLHGWLCQEELQGNDFFACDSFR